MEFGIEKNQAEISNLINEAEKVAVIQMNDEGLKKLLGTLTQKYKKNMDLRLKFKNNPEKFAESEADLNAELKNIQMVTAYPNLLLSFVGNRGVELLMDILGHENSDISIDVASILKEFTEDDVILANKENIQFIEYMISKGMPLLLIDTIHRLNKSRDEDLEGIFNILSILLNIADYKPDICDFYSQQEKLMKWLISYVTSEDEKELNDAKTCACELLSVILQHSKDAQKSFGNSDNLLEILKEINRRCTGEYENSEDYNENLFNIICSCLLLSENKENFAKFEGIQLMLKLMKCGHKNRRMALKTLDFALADMPENCKIFINSLGLSYLFAIFMKKGYYYKNSAGKPIKLKITESDLRKDEEHCVSIICSLFKYSKGVDHDRIIYKFKDKECEKISVLCEMYDTYIASYKSYLEKISEVENENDRDKIYIEELDNGLFTFQLICIIVGMLIMEKDSQILEKFSEIISAERKIRLDIIIDSIKEYIEHMENKENSREYEILNKILNELQISLSKTEEKILENNKEEAKNI